MRFFVVLVVFFLWLALSFDAEAGTPKQNVCVALHQAKFEAMLYAGSLEYAQEQLEGVYTLAWSKRNDGDPLMKEAIKELSDRWDLAAHLEAIAELQANFTKKLYKGECGS